MINLKLIPAVAGVYAIVHEPSNRRYIGSAENLYLRLQKHVGILKSGKHPNPGLQAEWNGAEEHHFVVVVLEINDGETVKDAETRHIQAYRSYIPGSGYNQMKNGNTGGRRANQTGRPRIPVNERKVFAGKVGIRVSAESAMLTLDLHS